METSSRVGSIGPSILPSTLRVTSGGSGASVDAAGIEERNRASLDRLRALGAALSEDDLARAIAPPWTAAGLFAHTGFWDRFVLERWKLTAERGETTPAQVDGGSMERTNDASLSQWMSIPPRAALAQCLAAAHEVDAFVRALRDDVRAALEREGRPRLVDRSLHREDHLPTFEKAFRPA